VPSLPLIRAVLLTSLLAGAGLARAQPAAPPVTVSPPLQREITEYNEYTGQFAATEIVEIRPRVGGYLTEQLFTDGQMVTKGDRLFTIDPRPYEIALQKAQAAAATAAAQLEQASRDVTRGTALRSQDFIAASVQDQRVQQMKTAAAALSSANADIRSAQLDLEFSHITAPVTGRIGAHQVSLGNLVTGGASIASPTLLTTIVALDPIWFNVDMSEADYLAYQREVAAHHLPSARDGSLVADVQLGDEDGWSRHGHVDFLDNQIDRSSGTIRVRASFANPDGFLTPGMFGRLRLPASAAHVAMLVPDGAVTTDQSRKIVMTVTADGHVVPKMVDTGPLVDGLRVIRTGLDPADRVVIDGLMRARPGGVVTPVPGTIKSPQS
jgi:RND family efflux transporter MFP subunit